MRTARLAQCVIVKVVDQVLGSQEIVLGDLWIVPLGFIVDIVYPSLDTTGVSSDVGHCVEDVLIRETAVDTFYTVSGIADTCATEELKISSLVQGSGTYRRIGLGVRMSAQGNRY